MILEDFDEVKTSTFNPEDVEEPIENIPKIGITCFSKNIIEKLVKAFNGEKITKITNANGDYPIYKINYKGYEFTLFMSVVGAPACTVEYEEIFAKGVETIIVFGTCGVLDKSIEDLAIIIPTSAIRDEGTSYHYIKASDEIEVNRKYKEEFIELLKEHNYSYVKGKTWTIDAPYRETKDKVQKRKKQGCICVEMECSAISALAEFREKDVFQFFYAADNLDSAKWDKRSLNNNVSLDEKEKIGLLAVDFAKKLSLKDIDKN